MSAGGDSGAIINDINVTPLVDVMLVLLIIFMVITPMLQAGVSVTMPEARNPVEDPNINKESAVVIAVPNDAEVWVGRDKYFFQDGLKQVANEVDLRLKDKPAEEQIVYIKSDQAASYGKLVEVINAVRDKGYDRIGLVTEKIKEKGSGA
jgi:biopolymer transport protein ExbD/biopolymer transport protein TolR